MIQTGTETLCEKCALQLFYGNFNLTINSNVAVFAHVQFIAQFFDEGDWEKISQCGSCQLVLVVDTQSGCENGIETMLPSKMYVLYIQRLRWITESRRTNG